MRFKIFTIILLLSGIASCNAQTSSSSNLQVDGKWSIILNSDDIGTVNTILEFETKRDGSFKARTRKGADRDILGFWKSMLARMFTKDFKNGSLIRITDGTITDSEDTLVLSGIFRSAMGNYYFNGEIVGNQINAQLKNGKQEQKGALSGRKNEKVTYPIDDYQAIISDALETTKNKIYNREVLKTKEWNTFEKTISKKSYTFQDDIEFVFAFYYFASKLPFSHYALTGKEEDTNQNPDDEKEQYLFLEEIDSNTALLTITSFSGTAAEVDSIFSEVIEKNYKHLIVDLRNNTGGTVEAGMAFAKKVVDTPLTAGFFLTQNWFNLNKVVPGIRQLKELPVFTDANSDLIIQGIHREKGLVLRVEPSTRIFKGNLFIITNRRTASTSEPIVHALKTANRATIVGERTAGAMLNSERFELMNGFSLIVTTADYYTTDGFRIDQNGIEPNIKLKDENPVEYIINQMIK